MFSLALWQNALGFSADAITIIGVFLVGRDRLIGWKIGLIGVVASIIYSLWIGSLPIAVINMFFVYIYIDAIINWEKRRKQHEEEKRSTDA